MTQDYFAAKLAALEVGTTKQQDLLKSFEEKIHNLGVYAETRRQIEEKNKNSWVNRLGLNPESAAGTAVNLGANFASGASRVGGQLAALPAYIGASWDAGQLTDRHYEAYERNLKGQATQEDLLYLNSKTYQDDRKDNPTILQSIELANNKRQLGREITERFDVSGIVQNEKKNQLAQDIGDGFDKPWAQVKAGWAENQKNGRGWIDMASGVGKLLANAGSAVADNKMGALEYVFENIPQLALGAAGKAGTAALTASNVGYASNEYQKGIEKFQKENGGAMPNAEQRQEMAVYAASLALAEQLGDVSILKGIDKIVGISDDAVKTGFKQALKGYAKEVTKATRTEAVTEGWQTFAEGKASLEEKTAKDIYVGSVIGGVAGGGMTAGAPALAIAGVAKNAGKNYQEAKEDARTRLATDAQNRAVVEEAQRTGNVDVFLNREDKANYDPSRAMDLLFQQDTKDFTPEQRKAHQEKVRSVITSFERDIAVQERAISGNNPELEAQLADFKAELAQNPQDTELQDLVSLMEAKAKDAAPSPEEVAAGQARIAELQPKLEQAREVYNTMLDGRLGELEQSVNVADTIQSLQSGKADPVTTESSVDKIRILSMVSPGAVSLDQAKALVSSGKLSDKNQKYFQLYINAETSIEKLKSMGKVAQEVLNGDPKLRQKGLLTYRTRFAQYLADGNQMLANREMRGLRSFRESHEGKLKVLQKAMQESKKTGQQMHVFKDKQEQWQIKALPPSDKPHKRAKGEYVIDARESGKLVSGVASELQAMDDTLASLEALKSPNVSSSVNNQGATNVPAPSDTNQDTTTTAGTVATAEGADTGTASTVNTDALTTDSQTVSSPEAATVTATTQEAAAPAAKKSDAVVKVQESKASGYRERTKYNADSAGVTVAIAVDFTTAGERLTKSVAGDKYFAIPYGTPAEVAGTRLANFMRSKGTSTLNIAGNGIYTLFDQQGLEQAEVNEYIYNMIAAAHKLLPITKIVSGGQTGVDLAGAVAAKALGIPAVITLPKGYVQRNKFKQDQQIGKEAVEAQIAEGAAALQQEKRSVDENSDQSVPPWEELKDPARTFSEPTPEQQSKIDQALATVKAIFGEGWATVSKVLVHTGGKKQLGTYYYGDGTLSLNAFMLENGLASLSLSPVQAALLVTAHELAHGRDEALGFPSSKAKVLRAGGKIYEEALASMDTNPKMALLLKNVVFKHQDPATVASELYAQLFTIYAFDKELLRENIPSGFAKVEQTINELRAKAQGVSRSVSDGRGDTGTSQESSETTADNAGTAAERGGSGLDGGQPQVSGQLSIFEDTHPHTKIIRKSLKQSAGRDNGTKRPLVVVKDFFSLLVSDPSQAAKYLKTELNPTQEATLKFFTATAQVWGKTLQNVLAKSKSPDYKENWGTEYHWKNVAEYFMTTSPENRNLVDMDQNMKTAIMAGAMAWVGDFYRQGLFNNDKSINGLLGRDSEESVTYQERDVLGNVGVRIPTAANAIGRRIIEALGLKATKDAPQDMLARFEASIGGYAVQLLLKEGILESTFIPSYKWDALRLNITEEEAQARQEKQTDKKKQTKPQIFVRLARASKAPNEKRLFYKTQQIVDALKGSQNVLEKLFSVEDGVTVPRFEPVPFTQNVVRKGKTAVPSSLAEVQDKKNQEANFLKMNMYALMTALAPEVFLQIAGAKEVNDDMQANLRLSQEAANDALERNYWNLREFVETAWAEHGNEKPIYLDHFVAKNQRGFIDNNVLNPQADKVARHMLARESWKASIDPANKEQMDNFKLRVLEGLGFKTDEHADADSVKRWPEKTEDARVKAAVAAIVHLRQNPGAELSAEQQQAILSAVKFGGEDMKTLDALNALADYQIGGGSPFTTELVDERDGKTNGPMATNLLFGAASPGPKTTAASNLFTMLNKGGFYQLGSKFRNYNLFRASEKGMDLYEGVTHDLMKKIRPFADTPALKAIWAFAGEMETQEGKVSSAGRKIVKMPITALHFGSAMGKGVDSMANTFVESVFKTIQKYHVEGRDINPLVEHLKQLLQLTPEEKAELHGMSSAELVKFKFKDKHIKNLKDHFTDALGAYTVKVLQANFAKVLERKTSVNNSANFAFGLFDSVYQAVRNEVIQELIASGELEVDKSTPPKPKWDLSAKQEAEVMRRVGHIRPVLGTAMSQLSKDPASGLSVSKTKLRLNTDKAVTVQLNKEGALFGKSTMSVSPQMLMEEGPGVAAFSVLIHSFDSAVSHIAAMLSEALNVHDAHVTGLGNNKQIAQNLNKAFWMVSLAFSPAQAMYESLEKTVQDTLILLNDPNTPNSVREAVRNYYAAAIRDYNNKARDYNDKVGKYSKPLFHGTEGEFVLMMLKGAKKTAFEADQVRLGALAQMAFVDQYTMEGGEYEVTDKDRAEAQAKLEALDPSLPTDLVVDVLSLDEMLEALPEAAQKQGQLEQDIFEDPRPNIQRTLDMSNAEASHVVEQVLQSSTVPEAMKDMLTRVQASMESLDITLGEAAAIELDSSEAATVVEYLASVQQNSGSTAFGVLGAPAIEPEADVVAMLEANPEMTGQEAVKALWSVLSKRGDFPQKAFYGKLLQMTMKVLGDNVRVKYVTPQTAPDEVLASPTIASRGWYVANNGTIYVLSPEFAASGLTAEVLVHELVHAALEELVENPKTAQQKQAVEELQELLGKAQEYVKANNLKQHEPAVSNVHELLAWGLSNADFQRDVLSKIQVPESARSNRVVKGLKRFITSLVKLMFGEGVQADKGMVNGFASLVGNATALYRGAAKQQKAKTQAGIAKTNKVYSQATVDPVQATADFTTEQVFEALDGTGNSLAFTEKLQGILADVVNHTHGPAGFIKAKMEERVGKTALDAWANAMARGERPFHGKVLSANVTMTAREAYVAEQVEAVMGSALANKNAVNSMVYRELEKVYAQAKEAMKGKIDSGLYNFVFRPQKDMGDKSDYMQRFIALGLANEQFNKALAFETRKPELSFKGKTFMQRLEMVWRMAVEWVSTKMTGTVSGQQADRRLDSLVRKLVQIEARQKDMLAVGKGKSIFDILEPLSDKAKDAVDFGKEKIYQAANSNFVKENSFAIIKATGTAARIVAGDRVEKVMEGLQKARNRSLEGKHGNAMQLLNYVKGPGKWLNAMSRAATFIQNERKDIMKAVTKAVSMAFEEDGSNLSAEAKKAVSAVLLRTGTFVLLDKFQAAGIQKLLEDDTALNNAIEEEVASLGNSPEAAYYVAQAKNLGYKQVTGWAGVRQNLNAHNIAHMYNSGYPSPANASASIPAIERLIALYGLKYSKEENSLGVSTLLDVMRTENGRGGENGIEMALKMHQHLFQDAKKRLFNGSEALMRHGYLPEEHNPHVEFKVVSSPEEGKELLDHGYVQHTVIEKDPNDPDQSPAIMYVRKGGGLPRWASGALLFKGTNARGKQKHNQYYNPYDLAGTNNQQSMDQIFAAEQAEIDAMFQGKAPEPSKKRNRMIPILNADGVMVDYRYEMKEDLRDSLLERNNDFDHLLGTMASNTFDKEATLEQNKQVSAALHQMYKKEFGSNKDKFVFVGQESEDPELKEMWQLMGSDTKRAVLKQWGMKGMWVPKEMVTPLFGYRKLSLSTIFEKEDRNAFEQQFVEFSTAIVKHLAMLRGMTADEAENFSKRTQVIVRQIEEGTEEVVREIKDTIVIKTFTVLWGNMTSNFSVLLMNGLSLRQVFAYQKEALVAVMDYQRDKDELDQLKLRLGTAYGVVDEEAMQARIVELENAIARNPAKELIDAGLLPTIVEDVGMEDNPYAYKGQFGKWVEGKTAKLNPAVVKAGRAVYMTHDSTLYKLLNKSTQYSDFVGRYALYKHETTRKRNPLSKEEALFNASETFVNYDLQLPPILQYMDDHGLMMFTKYFLSIQRVLVKLMKDKPLEVINAIALNNLLFDAEIITNSAAVMRIGNNPLSMGPAGIVGILDEGAVVSAAKGLF